MPIPRRSVPKRRRSSSVSKSLLFWAAFFVIIALLFVINIPKISQTWQKVFAGKSEKNQEPQNAVSSAAPQPETQDAARGLPSVHIADSEQNGSEDNGGTATYLFPSADLPVFTEKTDDVKQQSAAAPQTSAPITSAPQTAVRQTTAPVQSAPVQSAPAAGEEYRDRTVYLVQVDNAGMVFLVQVKRKVPVNDSPLVSTLNILLQGPLAGEKLVSLIPPGTRILGATVERSTAIINFNDSFLFNTYGAEGYVAQLKQIVWTATEFPNINEVDIRVDGKKIGYLGETIRLDRPRSRDSF